MAFLFLINDMRCTRLTNHYGSVLIYALRIDLGSDLITSIKALGMDWNMDLFHLTDLNSGSVLLLLPVWIGLWICFISLIWI